MNRRKLAHRDGLGRAGFLKAARRQTFASGQLAGAGIRVLYNEPPELGHLLLGLPNVYVESAHHRDGLNMVRKIDER